MSLSNSICRRWRRSPRLPVFPQRKVSLRPKVSFIPQVCLFYLVSLPEQQVVTVFSFINAELSFMVASVDRQESPFCTCTGFFQNDI